MVAGVGLAFVGAAWLYRLRTRRQLRMPTDQDKKAIGVPLARLAGRHANLSILGPDMADVVEAGSALGVYLNRGPLADAGDQVPVDDHQAHIDDGHQGEQVWAQTTPPAYQVDLNNLPGDFQ